MNNRFSRSAPTESKTSEQKSVGVSVIFRGLSGQVTNVSHEPNTTPASRGGIFSSQRAGLFREDTLKALRPHGITKEKLNSWTPPRGEPFFLIEHQEALVYLVTGLPQTGSSNITPTEEFLPADQQLTPEQAINEINSLYCHQAIALRENYRLGLRGHHLRAWQAPADNSDFSRDHIIALNYLFRQERLTPEAAVARLNGKTQSEAVDIYKSFYLSVARFSSV